MAVANRVRPPATFACARRFSAASARCWTGGGTTAIASWSFRELVKNGLDKFVDFAAGVLDFGTVAPSDARLAEFLGPLARIAYTIHDIVEFTRSLLIFWKVFTLQRAYKGVAVNSWTVTFLEVEQNPVFETLCRDSQFDCVRIRLHSRVVDLGAIVPIYTSRG